MWKETVGAVVAFIVMIAIGFAILEQVKIEIERCEQDPECEIKDILTSTTPVTNWKMIVIPVVVLAGIIWIIGRREEKRRIDSYDKNLCRL